MQWLAAHYKDLLLAVSAVDVFLISIFPNEPVLVKIKDFISKIMG